MFKKKIVFFTGSRSDYEILKPLILKLKKNYKIFIFVGPHHLQKKFGYTYKIIKKDKLDIFYKCKSKINYNNVDINKFIGDSVNQYKRKLLESHPDMVIILGDRYEVLSFVIASFFLKLKICHLHGGEITNGSFDDTIRHMISKMADYHFVTNTIYKNRLISMGETPKRIYNFGSIGSLNVKNTKLISKNTLYKKFKIPIKCKLVIITFHPETNSEINYKDQIRIFLNSLNKNKKYFFFFTGCNADPYGNYFNSQIKKFVLNNYNSNFAENLGGKDYFSLIKCSNFVLGNSSSGIYEVPLLKKITINVGTRQSGRLMPSSIINCELDKIKIKKILINFDNIKKKIKFKNMFYKKNVLDKISQEIDKIISLNKNIKVFYEK